jgi:hypothetical protein
VEGSAPAAQLFALERRAREAVDVVRRACVEGPLARATGVEEVGFPSGPEGGIRVRLRFDTSSSEVLVVNGRLTEDSLEALAVRVRLRAVQDWLVAHGDVDLVATADMDESWRRARVRSGRESQICLYREADGTEVAAAPICWSDTRPIPHLWNMPYPPDGGREPHGLALAVGPFPDAPRQVEVVEIRVPQAEKRLVGTVPLRRRVARASPSWTELNRPEAEPVGTVPPSNATFEPMPSVPPPEWLALLRGVEVNPVPGNPPGQGALAIRAGADPAKLVMCFRSSPPGWRCTAGPWPGEEAVRLEPVRVASQGEGSWVVELEQHQVGFSADLLYEDAAVLAFVGEGGGQLDVEPPELEIGWNERLRSFGREGLVVRQTRIYHDWQVVEDLIELRRVLSETVSTTYATVSDDDVDDGDDDDGAPEPAPRTRRTPLAPRGPKDAAGCWYRDEFAWEVSRTSCLALLSEREDAGE